MRNCQYCGEKLTEDRARFEVRVAPDYQPKPEACPGTYCGVFCWDAAKMVHHLRRRLIGDAETVLGKER